MKKLIKFLINTIPRPYLIWWSKFLAPFIDILYRGNKFTDPINGKSYRKFLPYGYLKQRDNALSPGTLSLERHRLLWLYLNNETIFFSRTLKVLHVAPEQCFYNLFKNLKNINYTTFDLNSPLADIKGDICNLPFKENSFDFILCNHVLEHINDDKKAMKELYRVLNKNGTAILQVPINQKSNKTFEDSSIVDKKERIEKFGQYDHIRLYGLDYFKKLESFGFKVDALKYSKEFTESEIIKYGLIKDEIIPVCKKA
ncbi:methyltransferase domain-containing protein [Flavobacteriaceae bacterium]|nr:methyltransferase domain-containing protein [Flavobacteriaceae bacterium]